jgi:hypothetical protein
MTRPGPCIHCVLAGPPPREPVVLSAALFVVPPRAPGLEIASVLSKPAFEPEPETPGPAMPGRFPHSAQR